MKWFSLVADMNLEIHLGQCYYDGVGVPEDEALGVIFFKKERRRRYGRSKICCSSLGMSLKTALNPEENLGNVVSVYQDESRAASIYNRFMDEERSGSAKDSATVIALQTNMESY